MSSLGHQRRGSTRTRSARQPWDESSQSPKAHEPSAVVCRTRRLAVAVGALVVFAFIATYRVNTYETLDPAASTLQDKTLEAKAGGETQLEFTYFRKEQSWQESDEKGE